MQTITVNSHTRRDGSLDLHLATQLPERDVEVLVVIQPLERQAGSEPRQTRGWPPGFFERTAGCLAADPMHRPPQGTYESRDQLP